MSSALPTSGIRLEIPARVDYVAVARLVVGAVASSDTDLSEARLEDLKLAVTEACTNAVQARASVTQEYRVVVDCAFTPDAIVVDVADQAGGFDPGDADDSVLIDDRKIANEGGWGIPLIKTLSDEAEFMAKNSGTTVRLIFYRAHDT